LIDSLSGQGIFSGGVGYGTPNEMRGFFAALRMTTEEQATAEADPLWG
jgi:hypothetical protein